MSTLMLDVNITRELKRLIESLTHSGKNELNKNLLERVIDICRLDERYEEIAYTRVMTTLEKRHSEVRLSCVQIYSQLFMNFKKFRQLAFPNLSTFFKFAMGIRNKEQLPPPKKAAENLLKTAIASIHKWFENFSQEDLRLKMAYEYLAKTERVDFIALEIVDPKEKAKQLEMEEKEVARSRKLLSKMDDEMKDLSEEMWAALSSLETCLSLLIPDIGQDHEDCSTEEPSASNDLRVCGIVNKYQAQNITIDIGPKVVIVESEENMAVLESARDQVKLICNRMLPKIKAWIQLINKAKGAESKLKKAMAQEEVLERALERWRKLDVIKPLAEVAEGEVSTDSELEEVLPTSKPKPTLEDVEASILDLEVVKKKKLVKNKEENRDKDLIREKKINKTKEEGSEKKNEGKSSGDEVKARKKELLAVAPKLPYDIDLYHWEDEKLPVPTLQSTSCEGHRFWCGGNDAIEELEAPGGSASLRTRVIEFCGKFEPVKRSCRAPLPSGKLCPRHDRNKCPLHGLIVDRDETGRIVNPEDEEKVLKSRKKAEVPEWQDPKLLKQIMDETGVDLKMPEKGRKRKRKKYPGLTDLSAHSDTPSNRLAKKVFNRASMKRVGKMMDNLDQRRHRDKFGDQFNYVHGSS